MKTDDVIERLKALIEELEELQKTDPDVPCEMYVNVPHVCCGCCSSGGYCYANGEEVDLSCFYIEKVKVRDRASKSQILQKIRIRVE